MSKWILYIGMLLMVYASFIYYPKWKMAGTEATISWDVSGYYLYLPALFIYRDIKELKWKPAIDAKYYPSSSPYQAYQHRSGNQVLKYTAGLAILYSPFFLIAHSIAIPLGYEADGYSRVYQFFISLGSIVWAFAGLWYFRKWILKFFDEWSTSLILVIIVFATNYFDYASITGAMSHNYLFTLYAILLYSIDNFYSSNKNHWFYLSCFVTGLMVLIRPTEIISILLLIGWQTDNIKSLTSRIHHLLRSQKRLLIGCLCFLFFPLVQSVYWKYVAGEWIVYSYQEFGFSWLEGHHILQGLFSYRAGWLVYTPVMILSLAGMFYALRKTDQNKRLNLLFILLSLYLTFAWDEWTYGGSLSQRALVQHYPIMAFPMAVLIKDIISQPRLKYILYFFIGICAFYNLWLTHQAHRGGIYAAGMMNKTYFWHTLFKMDNNPEYQKLLDTNEPYMTLSESESIVAADRDFNADSTCTSNSGHIVLYDGVVNPGKIRIHALVRSGLKEWDIWQMAQLVVKYKLDQQDVKTTILRLHRFLNDNDEKWIDLVTISPDRPFNKLEITIWNPGSKPVCAKALQLYAAKF